MAKRTRDDEAISSADTGATPEDTNKYQQIAESSKSPRPRTVIKCFLPPHTHPYSFSTYDELDAHYRKVHVNRCLECNKNFPTDHFLNLHIAENHDSLTEARQARGDPTFACFVEGCDKVCYNAKNRRLHLIDKHFFPKNYNFFITNDGVDRRHSMLVPSWALRSKQHPSASTAADPDADLESTAGEDEYLVQSGVDADSADGRDSMDIESSSRSGSRNSEQMLTPTSSVDDGVNAITKSMSSLNFIPPSVRFGRGKGRGFRR